MKVDPNAEKKELQGESDIPILKVDVLLQNRYVVDSRFSRQRKSSQYALKFQGWMRKSWTIEDSGRRRVECATGGIQYPIESFQKKK
jgi:hypothetical protein